MKFSNIPYLWTKRISPYKTRIGINSKYILNQTISNQTFSNKKKLFVNDNLPNKILLESLNKNIINTEDYIGLFYKSEYDKFNFYKIYSPLPGILINRNETIIKNPSLLFTNYNYNHHNDWLFDIENDFTLYDFPLVLS